MESTGIRRKFPWELHAIVVLLALLIGYAVSRNSRVEDHHPGILVSLLICMIGLFRGSSIAWCATLLAFGGMTLIESGDSIEFISRHGFRPHPILLHSCLLTGLCLTVTVLLAVCRIRGAFPGPARPLMEDLTAVTRLAAVGAPILFVLAALFSLSLVLLFSTGRRSNERSLGGYLKTLTSAEADFRANDRDENHVNDFWVGDVAGLYGLVPKDTPNAPSIKLIELSVATADGAPLSGLYPPTPQVLGPKNGGWVQALDSDRTTNPPTPYWSGNSPFNTTQFGFIVYPDDYIGGQKYAFIVNENNTVFRQALKDEIKASDRVPPGRLKLAGYTGWPTDDELKASWSKLD